MASEAALLNTARTPPFVVEDETTASEEMRLRYRYLDMRRPKTHQNLALRHRVMLEIRKTLDATGILRNRNADVDAVDPEGARDYLVPSRMHHGQFYALPQSPQIFKQILMIGGMDRYFQIVKCFRDEDLRADRQPEFTQLDLEMSFPRQEDIFETIEQAVARGVAVIGVKVKRPFRHLDYQDAMRRYGSDKPDLRFEMELQDVTRFFDPVRAQMHFEGNVQAVVAPAERRYRASRWTNWSSTPRAAGAKGVYTIKVTAEGVSSSLDETWGRMGVKAMVEAVGAKAGDLVVCVSAKEQIQHDDTSLGVAAGRCGCIWATS